MKVESEVEVLKAQGRWLAEKIEKMDAKLDRLLDSHWRLHIKVVAISASVSLLVKFLLEANK